MKRTDLKVGMHVAIGKPNPSRWDSAPKEAIVTNVESGPAWSRFSRHTHPSKMHVGVKFVQTDGGYRGDGNGEFGVVPMKIRGPWDETIAAYNKDQSDQKERERVALAYQADTTAKNTARWLEISRVLGKLTPEPIQEVAGLAEWKHHTGANSVNLTLDQIEAMLGAAKGTGTTFDLKVKK